MREYCRVQRDRRAAPQPPSPSRGTRTGLTEPCGALPRKCLFIHLLADVIAAPFSSSGKVAALVHTGGDDPLVKQETMSQINCEEPKPVLRGSAASLDQSSLCSKPDASIHISRSSRFVGFPEERSTVLVGSGPAEIPWAWAGTSQVY
jgi:hypothetical protein